MSNTIQLDEEHGLCPHIISCALCGEDTGSLTVGKMKGVPGDAKYVITGELCESCTTHIEEGCLKYLCDECDRHGLLNTDFSKYIKESMPEVTDGIRFHKCEQHGGSDGE